MNEIKIAPSILSADFARMGKAVAALADWGADWVHCDVMDGIFVPNLTFGMPMIQAIRPYTTLPLDVHLMIVEPERYIERFLQAGADIVTFHPEVSKDVFGAIRAVHARGKRVGLVLNPDIEPESIEPYLDEIDLVMLMGVYPGFGGQKFIASVLDKMPRLLRMIGARDIEIELDGGVTADNLAAIAASGVGIAVAGSSVFGASDPAAAIATLKSLR